MQIDMPGLNQSTGEIFEAIPAGIYDCRITQIAEKTTKPDNQTYPNSPMLAFTCKVAEGEYANRQVFFNIMLPTDKMTVEDQKKSINRFKRVCMACGIDTSTNSVDTSDLFGQEIKLSVIVKDGKNRVQDYLPRA
jgi:hypothetical protein